MFGSVVYCEWAKRRAVQDRINQLRSEGHGPQRHSLAASQSDVRRRARFNIDPAGGDQIEHGSAPPRLHKCAQSSSRIIDDSEYVRAEAMMRNELMNQVCPGGVAAAGAFPAGHRVTVTRPLTAIFPDPNAVCEGFRDPNKANRPKKMTSMGVALEVPTLAGLGHPNFGIGDPPPPPHGHPFTYPSPPALTNTRRTRFETIAKEAVEQHKDPQMAMNILNVSSQAPGFNGAWAAATQAALAALPLGAPLGPPPPSPAQLDGPAMDALAAADTMAVTFHQAGPPVQTGQMFALYEIVNPGAPCGPWRLVTMYPESI